MDGGSNRLQSRGSERVRHDWVTNTHFSVILMCLLHWSSYLPWWGKRYSHYSSNRTLRLRKVKEKVVPSHTVAEQEGYPRSVWFQYLHFISWQVRELLIQRKLEVKGGQRGSPTRKNLFPGPLSGHHHTEEECPGASVQSRKTLSFSLRQFLEAREDPCSFFFYHLVLLCSRCYTGWIGLRTFQNLLECHSLGSTWELLRNAGSQVPT